MQLRFALWPCLLIVMCAWFHPTAAAGQPDVETLARDNSSFAFGLYHQVAAAEGNVCFSPYSISTALAMTYAGARGNTEKEMAATLRFSLGQAELHPAFGGLDAQLKQAEQAGIRLRVANSLWPQQDYALRAEYAALIKAHYGVSITALDYRGAPEPARNTINQWVEDKTEDKIQDLIQPGDLSAATRLVLVNAIYFKGTWANQFKAGNTREAPFHVSAAKTVQAPLMSQQLECRYASLPALEVLELPYVGEALSMIVLLPKEVDGAQALERELSTANLAEWLGALRGQEVLVALPKFKLTCRFGLNEMLAAMGMVEAFSETKADFSGMVDGPDRLSISAVIHQAFVEVNEEGTEAAAATAVTMRVTSMPARPATFRADHPFVFLIQEKQTGSILFAGRLSDPTLIGK